MKNIFFIVLAITLFSKNKAANENSVYICKVANDTIRIDYFDSVHGITGIENQVKGDTLQLKISVCFGESSNFFNIKLNDGITFISTGKMVYQIDKIEKCKQVYSGDAALKQLKKQIK